MSDLSFVQPDRLLGDLENSWGLPARFYHDPEVYRLDLDAIYHREWQYLAPVHRLRDPGDVVIGHAGEIPVVVTRGQDGQLRGFVNVCRHRGYQVQRQDAKQCSRMVCRYHAWTYGLDGSLVKAPGSENDPTFNREELSLRPISVEQWGPAVFVNADPEASPRAAFYPGWDDAIRESGLILDPDHYSFVRSARHDVRSNWKMWYDNFVECYHCATIHSGSFSAAYESGGGAGFADFKSRFMISHFDARADSSGTALRANNYRSANTYPGFLILQQDDLMILSQMRPVAPERTEQRIDYFAEAGADPDRVEAWIELWEQTFTEDGAATVVQQEGFRTGAVERNRLMRPQEESVFFFNALTCRAYERHLNTLAGEGGAR